MRTIAIQGKAYSFHHLAAQKQFGNRTTYLHCQNFTELLESVVTKQVSAGIIAVENSLVGAVADNYQKIKDYNLEIVGGVILPIQLHLAAPKGVRLSEIKEIYSHPVALKECQVFFSQHPNFVQKEFSDTAGAIRWVGEQNKSHLAAIGGIEAIRHYRLKPLVQNIHDHQENFTTFYAIQTK